MEQQRFCLGLLRRRQCLVPTWRGGLTLLLALVLLVILGGRRLHPFLAINAPVRGGVLVVEGWVPDYAMQAVLAEVHQHHYDKVYVTGFPIERGAYLSEYQTYAQLGAATLVKLGLSTNIVQAVPAPWIRQDRTYASALSLRRWFRERGAVPAQVNVITGGAHARRSRLLFQKALGKGVTVGVMAVAPRDYEAERWWRSSQGVRIVIGETLAYTYARVFFRAPSD